MSSEQVGPNSAAQEFLERSAVHERDQVLAKPCPVPSEPGLYGWWFRRPPSEIDTSGCFRRHDLSLLYVGISPKKPPANGAGPSGQNLRKRIQTHYAGNAEGSTLRKSIGCLLADQLGIELRRVGSGQRMTFATGEQALSEWMSENALVSWIAHARPWEVEDHLISVVDLPLNLQGNAHSSFHEALTACRAAAVARARAMPVLPNPGVGGR